MNSFLPFIQQERGPGDDAMGTLASSQLENNLMLLLGR